MKCEKSAVDDRTRAATTAASSDETCSGVKSTGLVDFIGRLRAAQLLPKAILEAAIEDSLATNLENLPPEERLRRYLVEHNLLSSSQMARLGTGLVGGVYLGPYRLLKSIGSGGTARVYLAEHVQIQRRVALKLLAEQSAADPRVYRRFLREAHVFMGLYHPNIVRGYEFDESHGRPYLALEYVDGENLRDRVLRAGELPFVQAATYIAQAAGALDYLHQEGFVHRDVKPANLVVTRSHNVKLIDLGLVCGGPRSHNLLHSDSAHSSGGSVDYIAPEQINGFHEVDSRVDLYGLGGALYCLLTGSAPFPGGTASSKLERHLHAMPQPIEELRPDVPPLLAALCNSLLAKNPNHRPQSAGEVNQRLLEWMRAQQSAQSRAGRRPVAAPSAVKGGTAADRTKTFESRIDSANSGRAAIMTLEDVARFLKLPVCAVEAMAIHHAIPARNVGGEWRFHHGAIVEWLKQAELGEDRSAARRELCAR